MYTLVKNSPEMFKGTVSLVGKYLLAMDTVLLVRDKEKVASFLSTRPQTCDLVSGLIQFWEAFGFIPRALSYVRVCVVE